MKKCLAEKDECIANFESRPSKLEENKIVENVPTKQSDILDEKSGSDVQNVNL